MCYRRLVDATLIGVDLRWTRYETTMSQERPRRPHRRSHVKRPIGLLSATLLAAVAANACQPNRAVDLDKVYPPGSCVVLTTSGEGGEEKQMVGADCSARHTHVVVARVGPGATCPPESDAQVDLPGEQSALWCLRSASESGASPSP